MSSAFEQLLGSELLNHTERNPTPTSELLKDVEYVGFYFSAHWCGPCRGFTPVLAKCYEKLKKEGKKFEIVFISSDKDDAAFQEYAKEMPWVCLPFSDRERKGVLSKKYKVSGIPSLILLDSAGNIVNMDGTQSIRSDPQGSEYPWKPPTFQDVVSDSLVLTRTDKTTTTWGELKGKTVGFYFSAHWCPPCRGFTPKFVQLYKKVQEKHKDKFEVIFVSSDRSEDEFTGYLSEMPWLAIPFSDTATRAKLSTIFNVEGIPSLGLVDSTTGEIYNPKARGAVAADLEGDNFPWLPKVLNNLSEPEGINESPSLVVFMGSLPAPEQQKLSDEIEELAKQYKSDKKDILFFKSTEEEGVSMKIRALTSLDPSDKVQVILLDIPDDGGYYVLDSSSDATQKSVVSQFLQDYEAKKLQRQQLQ